MWDKVINLYIACSVLLYADDIASFQNALTTKFNGI